MAMILDLGQWGGVIQTTAEFSNAVLVAMLPQVTEIAQKLELPTPLPITEKQVIGSGVTPYVYRSREMAGWGVKINGDYTFGFHSGHFDSFRSEHSYYALQDPEEVSRFFGEVKMTQREAVRLARETLNKLGIPLEAVFADQEPRVTPPPVVRKTNTVPCYRIEWIDPRVDHHAVDMEVNAETKRVERILISPNASLRRPWPRFAVEPIVRPKTPTMNPEYAWELLPIVLRAVGDYAGAIGLPVSGPLSSNHLARFVASDNGGWPHSEIELTNGWRFVYRNSMVNGFYAPDNFFASSDRPIRVKDFLGKPIISEGEAVTLIRGALARLKAQTNLLQMNFKPAIIKPTVPGIPRWEFRWNVENEDHSDLISKVEAEVDMGTGTLKSLYYDHKAFWGHPPPIRVPINTSLPKRR